MKDKKGAVLKERRAPQGGTAPPHGSESPLDADPTSPRGMLERGDVEGARGFVTELLARWPESPIVGHYAQVLAPPQVTIRRGERGRWRNEERAWLREHAREYPGCWLAVMGNQLISANPDLAVVLAVVRQRQDEASDRSSTRLGTFSGRLVRIPVGFSVEEGDIAEVDATWFASLDWPGPAVVGWKGCLERLRFALDPIEERFYFGEP